MLANQVPDVLHKFVVGHDDDLVDSGKGVERSEGMDQDRQTSQFGELLGLVVAKAEAGAGGEDDG